jgi:hypothetical protein
MDVSGQLHDFGRFIAKERAPGTHWIGGWVGRTAVLDAVVKRKIPSPCRKSNYPIIEPIVQRCITELSAPKIINISLGCTPNKLCNLYNTSTFPAP